MESQTRQHKKKSLAVCRSVYRGFTIMETGARYIVFEGVKMHPFTSLQAATMWIDDWHSARNQ